MSGCWLNLNESKDMATNPIRANGLKLLDIKPTDMGADYGCGKGALLIEAAKKCEIMIGIDHDKENLKFIIKRLEKEKIQNCALWIRNLRKKIPLYRTFDFSIVNGVLEWIPAEKFIEIPFRFKKGKSKKFIRLVNPAIKQLRFLKMVYENLKEGGRLYLAIENRFGWKYFFGKRDEHTGLPFTSILPRKLANRVCNWWNGLPYETYTHSYGALKDLLFCAGFASVESFTASPSYHYPKRLKPLKTLINKIFALNFIMIATKNGNKNSN